MMNCLHLQKNLLAVTENDFFVLAFTRKCHAKVPSLLLSSLNGTFKVQSWWVKQPMCSEGEYAYYYDLEADTYCYPDSNVLINKFNIREQAALAIAERQITTWLKEVHEYG